MRRTRQASSIPFCRSRRANNGKDDSVAGGPARVRPTGGTGAVSHARYSPSLSRCVSQLVPPCTSPANVQICALADPVAPIVKLPRTQTTCGTAAPGIRWVVSAARTSETGYETAARYRRQVHNDHAHVAVGHILSARGQRAREGRSSTRAVTTNPVPLSKDRPDRTPATAHATANSSMVRSHILS